MTFTRIFLAAGVLLGLTYVFVIPPFQIPDEVAHFNRAYTVSRGVIVPVTSKDREVPVSYRLYEQLYTNIYTHTQVMVPPEAASIGMRMKYDDADRVSVDRISNYSPAAYLPQAFALLLCRMTGLPVIVHFYAGRIFSLVASLVLFGLAVRFIPAHRLLISAIVLMPMNMSLLGSYSADAMTNALVVCTVAWFLYCRYASSPMTARRIALSAVLVAMVSLSKNVYFVIAFLAVLIPSGKYSGATVRLIVTASIIALGVLCGIGWTMLISSSASMLQGDFSASRQFAYLFSGIGTVWGVAVNTFLHESKSWFNTFAGIFGWLDTQMPAWVSYLYILMLLAVAVSETGLTSFQVLHRTLFAAVALMPIAATAFSLYLTFTPVGNAYVCGIQTRYFIPLLMPLLLGVSNRRLRFDRIAASLLGGTVAISFVMSLIVIIRRFYPV